MKHHLTRLLVLVCLAFTSLGTLNAKQPRMEKAILFLEEALDSSDPIPLLQSAQLRLRNAVGNKSGFRVRAIQTIKTAITLIRQGGNADPQIQRAIRQVRAGINNASPAQP